MAPRRPQDGLRGAPDSSTSPQDGPRGIPDAQEGPERPPGGRKEASTRPPKRPSTLLSWRASATDDRRSTG
eukprot:1313319-Pyramimonas_sp.AAC.1